MAATAPARKHGRHVGDGGDSARGDDGQGDGVAGGGDQVGWVKLLIGRMFRLGTHICFEDGAGQGLRPPKGHTQGTARSTAGGAGAWTQPRTGQHRRHGLLPRRNPLPVLLQAAHPARAPGRAEGVLLAPVPRSDRHDPHPAPEPNPAEGIWSLLRRHLADFAAADLTHLTRVVKRKLKKTQYRPHLVDGCLPPTGLTMDEDAIRPPDSTSST